MDAEVNLADLPPDFVAASRVIGERRATGAMSLLRILEIVTTGGQRRSTTTSLPREFMVGLGLAVELYSWEINGNSLHLANGLPSAPQLLREVVRLFEGRELALLVDRVSKMVSSLSCKHLIWLAHAEHNADLAVVVASDQDPLDAIADFLWMHRQNTMIHGEKKEHEQTTQ